MESSDERVLLATKDFLVHRGPTTPTATIEKRARRRTVYLWLMGSLVVLSIGHVVYTFSLRTPLFMGLSLLFTLISIGVTIWLDISLEDLNSRIRIDRKLNRMAPYWGLLSMNGLMPVAAWLHENQIYSRIYMDLDISPEENIRSISRERARQLLYKLKTAIELSGDSATEVGLIERSYYWSALEGRWRADDQYHEIDLQPIDGHSVRITVSRRLQK